VVAVTAFAITLTAAPAAHASPSTSDLTKQINTASSKLEVIVESYDAMNISIKQTATDLKVLQASLAPAQAALKSATAQVGSIATTSYQQGRIGPMSALLDGSSSDVLSKLSILDQIQQTNQRDITTYTQTTQTFAQRQAALKATQAKQAAQLKEIAARKAKIQSDIKKLKAMRTAAYGTATQKGSKYTGTIPTVAGSAGKAVTFAYDQVGDSYQYGASGPSEWDCSGLTMGAWAAAGHSLPHNAAQQWSKVAHISRSQLAAGDLVFYNNLAHVGIYVGNDKIIDAPREGEPVDVRSINRGMPIYGYGRVT
jgi:cell wall-associated NlpC family hydrolase